MGERGGMIREGGGGSYISGFQPVFKGQYRVKSFFDQT